MGRNKCTIGEICGKEVIQRAESSEMEGKGGREEQSHGKENSGDVKMKLIRTRVQETERERDTEREVERRKRKAGMGRTKRSLP